MPRASTLPVVLVPVVLVAGFLGAGKTTLMRRLILDAHARGLKTGVIVNEFGASDVDGHVLKEANAELLQAITGGCACCAGQDDFHETLLEICARESSEKPDVILVEASGLADPVLLLDVLTAPDLLSGLRVAAILCVADAARREEYSQFAPLAPLLFNQLKLADFILLNKADLCSNSTLLELAEAFHQIAPRAKLYPAKECAIDFGEVWTRVFQETRNEKQETAEREVLPHAHAHTFFCPLPHPVEREKLESALGNLPGEVWRAKGFVRLKSEAGIFLLQYTGGEKSTGRFRFAPFHLPFGSEEPNAGIVFIGAHLDEKKLTEQFLSSGSLLAFW